jgi:hypothetical protein
MSPLKEVKAGQVRGMEIKSITVFLSNTIKINDEEIVYS